MVVAPTPDTKGLLEIPQNESGMFSRIRRTFCVAIVIALAVGGLRAAASDVNSAPNPYRIVENWAKLPEGRTWGQVIGVEIDPDGQSIWVLDRCGPGGCMVPPGSNVDPIQKFDRFGNLVMSFGAGMFNWPHGFFLDNSGNVWVTDGIGVNGKGNTVFKFSPDGRQLMRLGRPGMAGRDQETFNWPSDVLVAPNGNIFVADGHGPKSNARIVKFTGEGKFIREWGREGAAPGEFDVPHGLAIDSSGRIFVADRSNNRIQIFDQDGNFLAEWKQFGRPSGIYIDKNDVIYVTDSQSGEQYNAPFQQGIRIGSVTDGKVTAFVRKPESAKAMPECVAADDQGNLFGGFIEMQTLQKYVKN
jgi:DNA-binding beta-propeller fold protein YncE